MNLVTVRYFAAVKQAATVAQDQVAASSLAEALEQVRHQHGPRFAEVLAVCSFLVDGTPVGARDHATVSLGAGCQVDCLPPFAGG